jgi:hypothetical protein
LTRVRSDLELLDVPVPAQGAQKPTYRLFLDNENHITERREIEAESEAEAIAAAREWLDGKAMEIWIGPILVETLKPIHGSGIEPKSFLSAKPKGRPAS